MSLKDVFSLIHFYKKATETVQTLAFQGFAKSAKEMHKQLQIYKI